MKVRLRSEPPGCLEYMILALAIVAVVVGTVIGIALR